MLLKSQPHSKEACKLNLHQRLHSYDDSLHSSRWAENKYLGKHAATNEAHGSFTPLNNYIAYRRIFDSKDVIISLNVVTSVVLQNGNLFHLSLLRFGP